jgi:hypothetical protein
MEEKFSAAGLRVLAVHAPEFDFEHSRAQVEAAAKRFGKTHPIYMDNDFRYWRALGNHYWPSFYLVDRHGRIRYRYEGELRLDSALGRQAAERIRRLLAE